MWNLLSQVLFASAVTISAPTDCPSAAQVRQRLQSLLPLEREDAQSEEDREVIMKRTANGGLMLELREAPIGVLARRSLPPRASCEEQADIAATVIAAWQLEIHGAPPALINMPASLPVPTSITSRPPPAPRLLRYEISAAIGGNASGADFAPAGFLEGGVAVRSAPVLLRFALLGIGTHALSLGPGQARWTRGAARIGVGARLLPGTWTLDLAADGLLAILHATGEGFAQNGSEIGIDGGVSGSLRIGRSIGPLRLFFDATLNGWLRRNRLFLDGSPPQSLELPHIEGMLSVGVTYSREISQKNDRRS